jgi:hypothetical protein
MAMVLGEGGKRDGRESGARQDDSVAHLGKLLCYNAANVTQVARSSLRGLRRVRETGRSEFTCRSAHFGGIFGG